MKIHKDKFRNHLSCIVAIALYLLNSVSLLGQEEMVLTTNNTSSELRIGLNVGADMPFFDLYESKQVKYNLGLKVGASLDYYISKFGLGLDCDYLTNSVGSNIPSTIFYNTSQSSTSQISSNLTRTFFGIGPNYKFLNNQKLLLEINTRFGIAQIKGGEIMQIADNPFRNGIVDIHLVSTGYDDIAPSGKIQLRANYKLTDNLSIHGSVYFMHHLNVGLNKDLTIIPKQDLGIYYGESSFITTGTDNFTLDSRPPYTLEHNNSFIEPTNSLSSIGLSLGVSYSFGIEKKTKLPKTKSEVIPELKQENKIVVTVRDEISNTVIPNADVVIVDESDKIIATGTTNSFGAIEFNRLEAAIYSVRGNVYGEKTTTALINKSDFQKSNVVQREILYTNQSFILKGKVVNIKSRRPESTVQVRLTNQSTLQVTHSSSDTDGEYGFTLDKNSSYKLVGIKDNRLSNIESVSTVGLNRSTTLFVNLELGVENFDCNQGTLLNIKYDFDSSNLGPESLQELDRLVIYMSVHPSAYVEFSAHTDSRGDKAYNQTLSQSRAKSAVDYIMSRGISRSKIIAKGYGESQLLNQCSDGVKCSEAEHSINRRTEAKLICN